MLRIQLADAKPGIKLAMRVDHPTQHGHTLLKAKFLLNQASIDRLRELNVPFIWADYPSLSFLRKVFDPVVAEAHHEVLAKITDTFDRVQRHSAVHLPIDTYTKSIEQLITTLISNPMAAIFVESLLEGGGDKLMRHSSAVTLLSLLMGLRLQGYLVKQRKHTDPSRAGQVTQLGIGAMLHDIGVTLLDKEVRQRYEATGDESDWHWQQHTSLGYDYVHGKVSPTAATVVLNHHQCWDGSGYVGGDRPILEGQRIHIFSRIVGLAQIFDRIQHPACAPEQPTVYALAALLHENMLPKYDPQVIGALLAVTPAYPPGSMVRLSDGKWAVVIDHHPQHPCRPVVQIIPDPRTLSPDDLPPGEEIDLAQIPDDQLQVTECDAEDVSELNFTLPRLYQQSCVAASFS